MKDSVFSVAVFYSRLIILFLLISCAPATAAPPVEKALYVYRFSPPALLQISKDARAVEREIPLSFSPECALNGMFPAPDGMYLAAEVDCAAGPNVLIVDPTTGSNKPLILQPGVDSHFLSWAGDGKSVFLRVDSMGNPRVENVDVENSYQNTIPITALTYDIASLSSLPDFVFTFSRGLGFGSELWLAKDNGNEVNQLYADSANYISFARWSPDETQIAFIKIPDSQIPFTVGELWIMNRDGSAARRLADADAGHGYAANWSPDGTRIAFVARENPNDASADQYMDALISNIHVVEINSGKILKATRFENGRAETPIWSLDGNSLFFQYVMDGKMEVDMTDLISGKIMPVGTESACCPSWMRK